MNRVFPNGRKGKEPKPRPVKPKSPAPGGKASVAVREPATRVCLNATVPGNAVNTN